MVSIKSEHGEHKMVRLNLQLVRLKAQINEMERRLTLNTNSKHGANQSIWESISWVSEEHERWTRSSRDKDFWKFWRKVDTLPRNKLVSKKQICDHQYWSLGHFEEQNNIVCIKQVGTYRSPFTYLNAQESSSCLLLHHGLITDKDPFYICFSKRHPYGFTFHLNTRLFLSLTNWHPKSIYVTINSAWCPTSVRGKKVISVHPLFVNSYPVSFVSNSHMVGDVVETCKNSKVLRRLVTIFEIEYWIGLVKLSLFATRWFW